MPVMKACVRTGSKKTTRTVSWGKTYTCSVVGKFWAPTRSDERVELVCVVLVPIFVPRGEESSLSYMQAEPYLAGVLINDEKGVVR